MYYVSSGRLYYIGRYDSEDDALRIFIKYTQEIEKSGEFFPKKLKKHSGTVAELYSVVEGDQIINDPSIDPIIIKQV